MASGAKTSNTVEIFSYIARDQKSGVVKGEIKALEEKVVQEQLKKLGLDPVSIKIKKESVFENLEISYPQKRSVWGSLFFERTPEITEKINSVAGQIFLSAELYTKAGVLSHGQKQWLEIGLCLMQDPELLLLDEPVAGMSAREREQTAKLLTEVAVGRSMVVIEHDMAFVESIAQTVTVLHQGKQLAEGSMLEVQNDERVKEVYLGY